MGRSVSVPHNAVATAYIDLTANATEPGEGWDWDLFIEDLSDVLQHRFKSLQTADLWLQREEHVILTNAHANIVVCEYCGLVSVSLVPYEEASDYSDSASLNVLHEAWCDQVSKGFVNCIDRTFGGLRHIGTASNGEAFFQRI